MILAPRVAPSHIAAIVCLGLVLSLSTSVAAATLGDNIRTASNVGPFQNQIQSYVTERVKALSGNDPAAQSKAREDLISEVAPVQPPGQLSPQFLGAYAATVNNELQKLAGHEDVRVRLNAAIVAAKVAEGAKNSAMQPVTVALLKDSSDAVVWWALRSAKAVLPHALANPGAAAAPNHPLLDAIVQIGQKRPAVAQAVYDSLTIDPNIAGGRPVTKTVQALQAVLRSRVDQYKNGLPPDVYAETYAAAELVGRDVYARQSDAQKAQTAQLIVDLLSMSAQRSATVTREQVVEIATMMQKVGGALSLIGSREGSSDVEQIGLKITKIPPRTVSADELLAYVQPAHPALIAIPKFRQIPAPPKVGEMTDTGSPSPLLPPPATTQSTVSNRRN